MTAPFVTLTCARAACGEHRNVIHGELESSEPFLKHNVTIDILQDLDLEIPVQECLLSMAVFALCARAVFARWLPMAKFDLLLC